MAGKEIFRESTETENIFPVSRDKGNYFFGGWITV